MADFDEETMGGDNTVRQDAQDDGAGTFSTDFFLREDDAGESTFSPDEFLSEDGRAPERSDNPKGTWLGRDVSRAFVSGMNTLGSGAARREQLEGTDRERFLPLREAAKTRGGKSAIFRATTAIRDAEADGTFDIGRDWGLLPNKAEERRLLALAKEESDRTGRPISEIISGYANDETLTAPEAKKFLGSEALGSVADFSSRVTHFAHGQGDRAAGGMEAQRKHDDFLREMDEAVRPGSRVSPEDVIAKYDEQGWGREYSRAMMSARELSRGEDGFDPDDPSTWQTQPRDIISAEGSGVDFRKLSADEWKRMKSARDAFTKMTPEWMQELAKAESGGFFEDISKATTENIGNTLAGYASRLLGPLGGLYAYESMRDQEMMGFMDEVEQMGVPEDMMGYFARYADEYAIGSGIVEYSEQMINVGKGAVKAVLGKIPGAERLAGAIGNGVKGIATSIVRRLAGGANAETAAKISKWVFGKTLDAWTEGKEENIQARLQNGYMAMALFDYCRDNGIDPVKMLEGKDIPLNKDGSADFRTFLKGFLAHDESIAEQERGGRLAAIGNEILRSAIGAPVGTVRSRSRVNRVRSAASKSIDRVGGEGTAKNLDAQTAAEVADTADAILEGRAAKGDFDEAKLRERLALRRGDNAAKALDALVSEENAGKWAAESDRAGDGTWSGDLIAAEDEYAGRNALASENAFRRRRQAMERRANALGVDRRAARGMSSDALSSVLRMLNNSSSVEALAREGDPYGADPETIARTLEERYGKDASQAYLAAREKMHEKEDAARSAEPVQMDFATDADGNLAWTHPEGTAPGTRAIADRASGVQIVETPDGALSVVGTDGSVQDVDDAAVSEWLRVNNSAENGSIIPGMEGATPDPADSAGYAKWERARKMAAMEMARDAVRQRRIHEARRADKAAVAQNVIGRIAPGVDFHIVENWDALRSSNPEAWGQISGSAGFSQNAEAARLPDGSVVLSLDNIHSPSRLVTVIGHEAGLHEGLRRLFGDDGGVDAFLKTVAGNPDFERWRAQTRGTGYAKRGDDGKVAENRAAAEEAYVYLMEGGHGAATTGDALVRWARERWRKNFNSDLPLNDSELSVVARDAFREAMKGSGAVDVARADAEAVEGADRFRRQEATWALDDRARGRRWAESVDLAARGEEMGDEYVEGVGIDQGVETMREGEEAVAERNRIREGRTPAPETPAETPPAPPEAPAQPAPSGEAPTSPAPTPAPFEPPAQNGASGAESGAAPVSAFEKLIHDAEASAPESGGETRSITEGQSVVQKMAATAPIVETPVDGIEVDESVVPNFKHGAVSGTGIVEPLAGRPISLLGNPIVVYETADGRRVVVTGRHRLDLWKRNGMETIPARVIREADGWTRQEAHVIDAISNILDGNGTLRDYFDFFAEMGWAADEARDAGIPVDDSSKPGGQAWAVHSEASEDLKASIDWDGTMEDGLAPERAAIIAKYAPMSKGPAYETMQRQLLAAAKGPLARAGKTFFESAVRQSVREMERLAAASAQGSGPTQMDIFGDDIASQNIIANSAAVAKECQKRANEIRRTASILRTAIVKGGNLELTDAAVKSIGIKNRNDKAELQQAEQRLRAEADRWERGDLTPEERRDVDNTVGIALPGTVDVNGQARPAAQGVAQAKPGDTVKVTNAAPALTVVESGEDGPVAVTTPGGATVQLPFFDIEESETPNGTDQDTETGRGDQKGASATVEPRDGEPAPAPGVAPSPERGGGRAPQPARVGEGQDVGRPQGSAQPQPGGPRQAGEDGARQGARGDAAGAEALGDRGAPSGEPAGVAPKRPRIGGNKGLDLGGKGADAIRAALADRLKRGGGAMMSNPDVRSGALFSNPEPRGEEKPFTQKELDAVRAYVRVAVDAGARDFETFAYTFANELPDLWPICRAELRGAWNRVADENDELEDVPREKARATLSAIDAEIAAAAEEEAAPTEESEPDFAAMTEDDANAYFKTLTDRIAAAWERSQALTDAGQDPTEADNEITAAMEQAEKAMAALRDRFRFRKSMITLPAIGDHGPSPLPFYNRVTVIPLADALGIAPDGTISWSADSDFTLVRARGASVKHIVRYGQGNTSSLADLVKSGMSTFSAGNGLVKSDKGPHVTTIGFESFKVNAAELPYIEALAKQLKSIEDAGYIVSDGKARKKPAAAPVKSAPQATFAKRVMNAIGMDSRDGLISVTEDGRYGDGAVVAHYAPGSAEETARAAKDIRKAFPSAKVSSDDMSVVVVPAATVDSAQTEESPASPAPSGEIPQPSRTVSDAADAVLALIDAGEKFDSKRLFQTVQDALGRSVADGTLGVDDITDILELAVNRKLLKMDSVKKALASGSADDALAALKDIREHILAVIPTQSTRGAEKDQMQQFSTPPNEAFAAAWLANIRAGETAMEPSAGVGGIAVFARIATGRPVVLNELSPRRAEMLDALGVGGKAMNENAEHLDAILAPRIAAGEVARPTVVVMNPPFSNAAKTSKKNTLVGATHVEEALKVLAPGGRLVAVVGQGMAHGRSNFVPWWKRIESQYRVVADIGVNGREYAKYGTTYDNRILVIDKVAPEEGFRPAIYNVDSVDDIIRGYSLVRAVRPDAAAQEPQPAPQPAPAPEAPKPQREPAAGTSAAKPVPAAKPKAQEPVAEPQPTKHAPAAKPAQDGAVVNTGAQEGGPREVGDGTFSTYTPAKVHVEGCTDHPTALVETSAMASIEPPDPTYTPNIPKDVLPSLSQAQMEQVIYAGQSHSQMLPDGKTRAGYFIGDGTGVGKGREISAIILDNFRNGRRKAVWISAKANLAEDAGRDLSAFGLADELFTLESKNRKKGKWFDGRDSGIAFTTYDSLRQDSGVDTGKRGKKAADAAPKAKGAGRLQQIVDWFGSDYDGVIVFDESHNMANALTMKKTRGKSEPSAKALAAIALQNALPNARVVYVSATGATELSNFAYARRLGIFGEGCLFEDVNQFISTVQKGGMSAMEIVARDLKAMGRYLARSLSYEGVENRRVTHDLSPAQRDKYNQFAKIWRRIAESVDQALADNKSLSHEGQRVHTMIGGLRQMFFNSVLTSMQMDTILKDARAKLDAGESVVFQLTNTNEAQQDRAVQDLLAQSAESGEALDWDDLDISPRGVVENLVRNYFPTQMYEEVEDEDGNVSFQPVYDANGNPVENPKSVRERDDILRMLAAMSIDGNPIDRIIDEFGADNVAEVTGRTTRFVNRETESGVRRVKESRSRVMRSTEAAEFNDGKRRVLVFNDAGGTGFSFHANRDFRNQTRRNHYLVQAGWIASNAIQGFGRTHRSNEAIPPIYYLCSTDVPGHRRFISTIARRLAQLGSLTSGDRSASGGVISESDNLENAYASAALRAMFERAFQEDPSGFDRMCEDLSLFTVRLDRKTGAIERVNTLFDSDGNFNPAKIPTVPQFLNKILASTLENQAEYFDRFTGIMHDMIDVAMQSGTYDPGLQKLAAEKVEVKSRETIREEPATGSTDLVGVDAWQRTKRLSFDGVMKRLENAAHGQWAQDCFWTNRKSGRICAIYDTGRTESRDGAYVSVYRRINPNGTQELIRGTMGDIMGSFERVDTWRDQGAAERLWNEAYDAVPDLEADRKWFLTGTLLPVWSRVADDTMRVFRVSPDDGSSPFIGLSLTENKKDAVMELFGKAGNEMDSSAAARALRRLYKGERIPLANGWQIRKSATAGESHLVVDGPYMDSDLAALERLGARVFRKGFKTTVALYVSPGGDPALLEKVLDAYPPERGVVFSNPDVREGDEGAIYSVSPSGARTAIRRDPRYGVGKRVGNSVYAHRDYILDIVPPDLAVMAAGIAEDMEFGWNCFCYDPKRGVRLDEAPDFDTAREPRTGRYMWVSPDGGVSESAGSVSQEGQIWHHKWLWVRDDYAGFDVEESRAWSRRWLAANAGKGAPSGYMDRWNERLAQLGLPKDGFPEPGSAMFSNADVRDEEGAGPLRQKISSRRTSLEKNEPALYADAKTPGLYSGRVPKSRSLFWDYAKAGDRNFEIGAGVQEHSTYIMREHGVENVPYDLFNRPRDANRAAIDAIIRGERFPTVTCANVLNVIAEPEVRANVIKQAAKAVTPDGAVFFDVYTAPTEGVRKKGGEETYQTAMKPAEYEPEIRRFFRDVERRGSIIVARGPIEDALASPATWWDADPDRGGEAAMFSNPGVYTGSAADYAQRVPVLDKDGNVTGYRIDNAPSLKHVGTGEGSQVYGWGLYGSDQRGVAEGYANMENLRVEREGKIIPQTGEYTAEQIARSALVRKQGRKDDALKLLEREAPLNGDAEYKEAMRLVAEDVLQYHRNPTPHLYEQTFFTDRADGDESHLLKWYSAERPRNLLKNIRDNLSSEQADAFKRAYDKAYRSGPGGRAQAVFNGDVYEILSDILGSQRAASEFLRDKCDIDGVKYPVDSFRGPIRDGDKVGWNYVSFRDDNIRVDHKWVDGQAMFSNPDVRGVTPEEDAAYMDAVSRGDMETAQRMVREAAARAMPDTKVVDEDGLPLVVYHGTPDSHMDYDYTKSVLNHAYVRLTDAAVREFNDEWHRLRPKSTFQFNNIFSVKWALESVLGYEELPGEIGILQRKAINLLGIWKPDEFGHVRKHPHDLSGFDMRDYLAEHFDELTPEEQHALKGKFFTVFDIKKGGYNTEASDAKMGFFFTPDKDTAYRFTYHVEVPAFGPVVAKTKKIVNGLNPKIYACFLNATKIFDVRHITQYDFDTLGYALGFNSLKEMRSAARSINGQKEIQKRISTIADILSENGYDGMWNRIYEGKHATEEIIVFRPNQIKLADPVTYDDAGNVIPLSQRFNRQKEDVRFSNPDMRQQELPLDDARREREDPDTPRLVTTREAFGGGDNPLVRTTQRYEERLREALEMPEVVRTRETNREQYDRAVAILSADPRAGADLVARINAGGYNPTATDRILLDIEQALRENEYADAREDYQNALAGEGEFTRSEIGNLGAALDTAELQLEAVSRAGYAAGSAWGRAGQAAQVALRNDTSLAGIMRAFVKANGGNELTVGQVRRAEELREAIEEAERKLHAKDMENAALRDALEFKAMVRRAGLSGTRTSRIANPEKRIRRAMKRYGAWLGLNPRPSETEALKEWNRVRANFFALLAQCHIAAGFRGNAEALVRAIQADFEDAGYEAPTDREITGGISRYDRDVTPLSQDERDKAWRDLRAQMLVLRQIDAMKNEGEVPRKLSPGQDPASKDLRDYRKERNEFLKKHGFDLAGGADRLKTAQASMRTRLDNRIEDLEAEIAQLERGSLPAAPDRSPVPLTPELRARKARADALRRERDELRRVVAECFEDADATEAERVRRQMEAAERMLRKAKLDAHKAGWGVEDEKSAAPDVPDEVKALRDEANAYRALARAIRAAGATGVNGAVLDEAVRRAEEEAERRRADAERIGFFDSADTRRRLGAEAEQARRVAAAIRKVVADIRRADPANVEAMIDRRIESALRRAAEWERKVMDARRGIFAEVKPKRQLTFEEAAAAADIRLLQQEYEDLWDAAHEADVEERELQRYRRSLYRQIADANRALLEGVEADGKGATKHDPRFMDDATYKLYQEVRKAKSAVENERKRIELERASWAVRNATRTANAVGFIRSIQSSWDVSYLGRQGQLGWLMHPVVSKGVIGAGLRAQFGGAFVSDSWLNPDGSFRSIGDIWDHIRAKAGDAKSAEQYADETAEELRHRDNWKHYVESGLYLSAVKGMGQLGTGREEEFAFAPDKLPTALGRFVKRGMDASERGYTTYLNKLRADLFDNYVDAMRRMDGAPLTEEEYKEIARLCNLITGRGALLPESLSKTQGGRAAETVATALLWSPRNLASKFELPITLIRQGLSPKSSSRVRKMAAKELAKLLGMGLVWMWAGALAIRLFNGGDGDDDKERVDEMLDAYWDPLGSDFGKVRIGAARIDIWAGMSQAIVFSSRMITGRSRNQYGKTSDADRTQIAGRFLRTKLAPVPSYLWDIASGKDFENRPLRWNPDKEAGERGRIGHFGSMFAPLSVLDLAEAVGDLGLGTGALVGLMAMAGQGVQMYEADNYSAARKAYKGYKSAYEEARKAGDRDRMRRLVAEAPFLEHGAALDALCRRIDKIDKALRDGSVSRTSPRYAELEEQRAALRHRVLTLVVGLDDDDAEK